MPILDTDNNPITYLNYQRPESTDSPVFTLLIPCAAGQVLKAAENDDVSVHGRVSGVGSYVDLFTDPISLDAFAGTNQAFDLFLRTNAVDGFVSTAIDVTAGKP